MSVAADSPRTPAEHAEIIQHAIQHGWAYRPWSEYHRRTGASLAALVALADRPVGRLADDEVCACLLETGERQVEIVERCVRCGALMRSDAYHDGVDLAERQRDASLALIGNAVLNQDAFDDNVSVTIPITEWRAFTSAGLAGGAGDE